MDDEGVLMSGSTFRT